MKARILLYSATVFLVFGCVSKKKYDSLLEARLKCGTDSSKLAEQYKNLKDELNNVNSLLSLSNSDVVRLKVDSVELVAQVDKLDKRIVELQTVTAKSIEEAHAENERIKQELFQKNEEIKAKEQTLAERETALANQTNTIKQLMEELSKREARVKELENAIHAKDSAVNALRNSLVNALKGYTSNGLSISVKNGKVYVSMEEKLLFQSGSVSIDANGKKALLDLAAALKSNKDIQLEIEGHTDNKPMSSGVIKDNWDLSVLRATTITRILTDEGGIPAARVLPCGRGENMPVSDNGTVEGRAKNRRTEIIISPNLDKILEMLGEVK